MTEVEQTTHRLFDNLLRLILPVLGVLIPLCALLRLLFGTTPCHFDVGELVVGMKDCIAIQLAQ
jgi:hypothetical protein